jgi:hypothetical protein
MQIEQLVLTDPCDPGVLNGTLNDGNTKIRAPEPQQEE